MKKRRKGRIREFERGSAGKSLETYRQEREEYAQAIVAKRKKKFRLNKGKFVLTAILLVLIVVVGMSVKTVFDLRAEQRALKEDNETLAAEEEALKEELKNVNDLEYIEDQARMQLKLIKPGEILYILQEQNKRQEGQGDDDADEAAD